MLSKGLNAGYHLVLLIKMKILLDTNIIIHRETSTPKNKDIGSLFCWIDNLKYQKFVHQVTINEINKLQNEKKLEAFTIKLGSYNILPTIAPLDSSVKSISGKYDTNNNDINDTILLNEVFCNRVDLLLTEDRKILKKAIELGIADRVFTIDSFLEKVTSENPELMDYKVLSVRKEFFGNIDLKDDFFNSLRSEYNGFEKWFSKKSNEIAYVCRTDNKISAFLYVKVEGLDEPYSDISPVFPRKKRLKIGTLKVTLNGYKLGERFIKIIFDNALLFKVDEIYVTIFPNDLEHERLLYLLEDYGFKKWGVKTSVSGEEQVYVRDFSKKGSLENPKSTYPFISKKGGKLLTSIYPEYHTNLFPDSILRTESPDDFVENEPVRNAISKVYISRSIERNLKSGDIVIFYRTGGFYKGVITTIGVIENVVTNIRDERHFISLCRKRSVFSDKELKDEWDKYPRNRPFVINFLYVYSFPKRINLAKLIELGVIADVESVPRGFNKISEESFNKVISETESNESIIVD
jgi:hypothetical protein